jgi:hypothetical protein
MLARFTPQFDILVAEPGTLLAAVSRGPQLAEISEFCDANHSNVLSLVPSIITVRLAFIAEGAGGSRTFDKLERRRTL